MLVGASDGAIIKVANDFEPNGGQRDVFGGGKAGERIVEVISGWKKMKICYLADADEAHLI